MSTRIDVPITERLSQVLASEPDIVLATMFGSVAEGRQRVDSDVDVAVLSDRPLALERRQQLVKLLAIESGRPVDLVDLRTAGAVLLRSAVLRGRRLFCRDNSAYAALMSRALFDSADFLPYRERLLRQRRTVWTG